MNNGFGGKMLTDLCDIPEEATKHQGELILRTKYLRRRARWLAKSGNSGRMRPLTCFKLLGLEDADVNPITAASFLRARTKWITLVRESRQSGETEYEKVINVAWQHLKNWRCPVCGGMKLRVRSLSCGRVCGDNLRRKTRLKKLGPFVLRMQTRGGRLTGKRYRGHALRRAQLTVLRNALEKCGHCVAEAARELGMSYGTAKYYIHKFGGYVAGERTRRVAQL